MFCQQCEQIPRCTGCKATSTCAEGNSCDMEKRGIKQCGDTTVRGGRTTQSPGLKQEAWVWRCRRGCQQSNCRILSLIEKLEA